MILIALDSFKDSISQAKASEAIKAGIKAVLPRQEIQIKPISDGGDGMLEALSFPHAKYETASILNPLFKKIKAKYIIRENTAIIEAAKACGLDLIPKKDRNPLNTTSYGLGELILAAAKKGCKKIILGLGGSATNDAGMGMLRALGYRFLDQDENELEGCGADLAKLAFIDDSLVDDKISKLDFLVACDVQNPLYGQNGAAFVYAGQKGAKNEDIKSLDAGLQNFARVCKGYFKAKNIAANSFCELSGSGAAGGLGYAFHSFLNAKLKSGFEIIAREIKLEDEIKKASLIITGEGYINSQSLQGKAPLGVASLAKKHAKPCIALAGGLSQKLDFIKLSELGLNACFPIHARCMGLDEAMKEDQSLKSFKLAAINIASLLKATGWLR